MARADMQAASRACPRPHFRIELHALRRSLDKVRSQTEIVP